MLKRQSTALLLVCGTFLASAGFFAGIRVEGFRGAQADSSNPPSDRGVSERVWPIADVKTEGRIQGEFEHQAALILGVNELIQFHPQTLAQIVAAIHDRIKIIGVVADDDQRAKTVSLLKDNRLPEDAIDFFEWPVEAMWVRDYAPFFVVGDHTTVVDFTYPEQNRDLEDSFAVAFAATFRMHYDHCHLTLEGGNLTSNGGGLCVSTTKLGSGNERRGYDAKRIGELLFEHFHFTRWVHLNPLEDEPTGHADMFVTLCARNKAILGFYRSEDDKVNAEILDQNAAVLKGEPTKDGPMDLIRIPMPSHKDGNWRTYTNVIYANGVVLVPQYPDTDPDLDKVALNVFHEALPDWKIVGIDCSKLITKRGALHCISRNVPALDGLASGK
ncbi:MAG TPA: agmatine deiminase family protein [Pirellulales bacterium]|jgi:agmatine/peptidylarginine deiminase|nr:agmatine deiminase family protein [Pirellulales bacterium]